MACRLQPLVRDAVLPPVIEKRNYLALHNCTECRCIKVVLRLFVLCSDVFAYLPAITSVIGLAPPAIHRTAMESAVDCDLHVACAACFQRPARRVQPYVCAGNKMAC